MTEPTPGLPEALVEDAAVTPAGIAAFLEGPAADAHGMVYFSDIANNRIMRLMPGAVSADVFLQPSGRSNGLMFDAGGNYRWLTFHAGVSEEMTENGSVILQTWLDGKKAHETSEREPVE